MLSTLGYLLVSMVVRVDVVVKLLVLLILLVTEFTVEVGFKIFQSFCYRVFLFSIILEGGWEKVILVLPLMLRMDFVLCS